MFASIHAFFLLELLGTVAFALSGTLVAVKKDLDLFGVVVLGVVTAVGGGILRDLFLGCTPPVAFTDPVYGLTAAATAVLLFVLIRLLKDRFFQRELFIETINNLFDAVGLAVFTVTGMQTAIARGYADNWFFVIFLGVITGVGGGALRDLLVNSIPMILRKRIYALASVCGGISYYLIFTATGQPSLASAGCIILTILLRLLASIFHWNLPRAL